MTVALTVKRCKEGFSMAFHWQRTAGRQWRPTRMTWIQAQGRLTQINDLSSSSISKSLKIRQAHHETCINSHTASFPRRPKHVHNSQKCSFDETYKSRFQKMACVLKSFLASSFWMNGSCLRASFWIANSVFLLLSCLELIGVLSKGGLRTWWIGVETTSSLVPFV